MSRPSPEELELIRTQAISRDLRGLPGFDEYEKESHFTPPWSCECGVHACSEARCTSCGQKRPDTIHDVEQEGEEGYMRTIAGRRRKRGQVFSLESLQRANEELELSDQFPPLYE